MPLHVTWRDANQDTSKLRNLFSLRRSDIKVVDDRQDADLLISKSDDEQQGQTQSITLKTLMLLIKGLDRDKVAPGHHPKHDTEDSSSSELIDQSFENSDESATDSSVSESDSESASESSKTDLPKLNIRIYGRPGCRYSTTAMSLLKGGYINDVLHKDSAYQSIDALASDAVAFKYTVPKHLVSYSLMPRVYIDNKFIGGLMDLIFYMDHHAHPTIKSELKENSSWLKFKKDWRTM